MLEQPIIKGILHEKHDHALDNYTALQKSSVILREEAAKDVFTFVDDFFLQQGSFPQLTTIEQAFKKQGNRAALKFMEDLSGVVSPNPADYKKFLADLTTAYRRQDIAVYLKEAAEILRTGKKIGVKDFKGPDDCLSYLLERAPKLARAKKKHKTSGDIREDAFQMRQTYMQRKDQPLTTAGILSGYREVDLATRGAQKGELWLTAGFVGNYKSLSLLNSAHLNMTAGKNILFFSLEMPYEQVRQILYCIHSGAEVFSSRGYEPLDYERLKTGRLTPIEEEFYLTKVIPDFNTNPNYGKLIVHQMDGDGMSLVKMQAEAEIYNRDSPLHAIYVDYLTIVRPSPGQRYASKTEAVNDTVQRSKEWALEFDQGRSIPILSAVQINRQGYQRAEKNEGTYDMLAIAEFNQVEKAADVIVALYKNDAMVAAKEAKATPLKSRDSRVPATFQVYADPATKQMGPFKRRSQETHHNEIDTDFVDFVN